MKKEPTVDLQCSFCGKHQREVRKLIAGPTVYICDECIKLCNDIIAEEVERESSGPAVQPVGDPGDPPGVLQPSMTALDEAVAALRKVQERLPNKPSFVSYAVTLLESSAELLRSGLEEWDARARSAAAEAGRRRELERQEGDAMRLWGLARDDLERTRATVTEVEASLDRLRGAVHEALGGEHRLLLDDVGLKLERLRGSLSPDRGGTDGFPVPPLDGRAWAILVMVAPHLWRISRVLRDVLRDGARTLGYRELGALEGVLADVTSLGEQLGLELRAGWSRWHASELRARFDEMQKTVTTVQQQAPARFLSPPVLRALEETVEELRSVTSRLGALDRE